MERLSGLLGSRIVDFKVHKNRIGVCIEDAYFYRQGIICMEAYLFNRQSLAENGFVITERLYSAEEIRSIVACIERADQQRATFRRSNDLFAIRQFLKEVPESTELIFNERLQELIREVFGKDYFVVKSIYFDKPQESNWYVAWHQDLTISVDMKIPVEGYGPWTVKQNQFAVQPSPDILESVFTIRIHLDDTTGENGAMKVIPGSHRKGIFRPETIDWSMETAAICDVKSGCAMIMKPLLLHSSSRTTNGKQRRVIHIEFSDKELPEGLRWAERSPTSVP